MVTILSLLAGLAIVGLLNLISNGVKNNGMAMETDDIAEEEMSEEEQIVLAILKAAFRSITIQKGAGYGPWLSSLIERGGAEPDIALTAIRWTIRDILSAPISYDKDWREMPRRTFDLGGLYRAEAELMRIMGEGE